MIEIHIVLIGLAVFILFYWILRTSVKAEWDIEHDLHKSAENRK